MKKKKVWIVKPIYIALISLSVVLTGTFYFFSQPVFFIALPIVICGVVYSIYRLKYIQREMYRIITSMGKTVSDTKEASLINFPLSAMIVSESNEILWYNDLFRTTIINGQDDIFGENILDIFGKDVYELGAMQGIVLAYNGCFYEVFSIRAVNHNSPLYTIYFVDITDLQINMNQSRAKRPVVMMILIDNYDEVIGGENGADEARLMGDVRNAIQGQVDKTTGFVKKLDRDRFVLIIEKENLDQMKQNRFDILDTVRNINIVGHTPVTLSIGVCIASTTLIAADRGARQALDMSLGRGGDQAAIKTDTGYEFFGGYSKGIEKSTKVKTRIVANALVELITSAENVLVMGHRFADLDCLGAAIGMAKAALTFNSRVNIVLDSSRNLADCMVQRLVEAGQQDILCLPDIAVDLVVEKTLLIIVDTHSQVLVESNQVYKKCKQVVIIDHHRKLVNYIDNAVIFHHEPYASSASEMVTELVQYFGDNCKLTHLEAEALLAGITLDTRNFVIRTGVRTFEAAAYLRRLGADTVEVRKFFASTIDSYQRKARVVSSAEVYKQCAFAICDFVSDDLRIIAPQAADELLGISDVKASFVLYEQGDAVNVSARSMGALNVQVIMEKLGGGGHHTMAGAQVTNSNSEKVRQQLLEIIDDANTL